MRTVGVDLSSKPKKTAMCEIEWGEGRAYVRDLALNVDDQAILDRVADLKKTSKHDGDWAIGIDAPFGWPRPFIEFINHTLGANPPLPLLGLDNGLDKKKHLRYRLTDLQVITELGLFPLAVAADKIALPAMRCVALLDALKVIDRSGDGEVIEVYPAAALKAWGLPLAPFPVGATPADKLAILLKDVKTKCPWLAIPTEPEYAALLKTNRDAFDALIAALVTRAAALGRTIRPNDAEMDLAKTEGWIAIPKKTCDLSDHIA